MKQLAILVILGLSLALTASAANVLDLQETFASGATFNGTVTFTSDYSNVTAVDGYLVGGPYGDDYINWIWDPTRDWASSFGPEYGGNFLMDGTTCGNGCGDYTYWITLTWDFSAAPDLVLASPGGVLAEEGGNNVNYYDALVSGSFGSVVPEPATLGLFVLGLGALGLVRRRKAA
jgi:hypothetical protein